MSSPQQPDPSHKMVPGLRYPETGTCMNCLDSWPGDAARLAEPCPDAEPEDDSW